MAGTIWDKSRMPSRHVTVGPQKAPQRSYYYAMGLTPEECGVDGTDYDWAGPVPPATKSA